MTDFPTKERKVIEAAWVALEYCAQSSRGAERELAESLKYETGSKTAGRPRIWAKALMVEAYREGRYGSTETRRKWLYDCLRVSPGIRYAYLLGCSAEFRTEMETHIGLPGKIDAAVAALENHRTQRAA